MNLRPDTAHSTDAPHSAITTDAAASSPATMESVEVTPAGFVLPQQALSRLRDLIGKSDQRQQRVMIGIVGSPGAGKSTVAQALRAALAPELTMAIVPMDGFHLANRELARLGRAARKGAPDTFDAAGYVSLLRRLRDQPAFSESEDFDATAYAFSGFESAVMDVKSVHAEPSIPVAGTSRHSADTLAESENGYIDRSPDAGTGSGETSKPPVSPAEITNEDTVYAPAFHREMEEAIAGEIPISAKTTLVVTEGNYLLLDAPHWRDVAALLDDIWFIDVAPEQRHAQLLARHMAHGRTREAALAWIEHTDEPNARRIEDSVRAAGEKVFHLRIDRQG